MAQTGTSGAVIGAPAPLPAALAAQAAAAAASSSESAANKDLPRDARIIGLLLASMGATDAEPGVVAQLLEFAHRMAVASRVDNAILTAASAGYTLDILQSASIYAEHASRPRDSSAATSTSGPTTTSSGAVMEIDDLRIAVSSKLEHSYSSPLPKEFLLNLASQINKVPLPVIPDSYGIRLPHERERLTAPNWDLEPVKERRDLLALEEQERQKQAAIDSAANMQANASTSAAGQDMDVVEQGAREDLMGGAQQEDEDEDGENEEEEAEGEEDEEDEDEDEDDDEMEDALQSGLQPGAEAVNTSAQEGGDNSMNGDDEEDAEGSGEASGADA